MKHEDIMKLCVDLEEEIEKGLEDGSIVPAERTTYRAFMTPDH